MTTIKYYYYNQSKLQWLPGEAHFKDAVTAQRFMWGQRKKDTFIVDYVCDNPEDTSYLNSTVNLLVINRGKLYA